MTALGMLVLGLGVTLVYSGVKGDDPRDVLRSILTGKSPAAERSGATPGSNGQSGLPGAPGGGGSSGSGTGGGGGTSW